jgi:tetratricopeptide (TPR) repeat protein
MLRLRGSLTEAESEARRAAEELEDFLTDVAGEAFYEIGEVRLRMGDLSGAEAMFAEAHSRGRDPQPGLALLRLAQQKPAPARAMIERALIERGLTPLDRARLLPAVVEIRLASGDLDGATQAANEIEAIARTYPSPALTASAGLALGRVELARGRAEPAMVQLRRACRIWSDIELPIELAQTRLLLSSAYAALGNAEDAALEQRTAHATMERVGAGTVRTRAPGANPTPSA